MSHDDTGAHGRARSDWGRRDDNFFENAERAMPSRWVIPAPVAKALIGAPRFFNEWGFELQLGEPGAQEVDLAFHAVPETFDAFSAYWQHPVWHDVKAGWAELRARQQEFPAELALEFDFDGFEDGQLIPGVFVVFDTLADEPSPRTRWALDTVMPKIRGRDWSPATRARLDATIAALPLGAYVAHFGVLLSRPINAVRLCVAGVNLAELPTLLEALGLGDHVQRWRTAFDWTVLEAWGHPAFLNIDIGDIVYPQLGIEFHRTNDVVVGIDPGWHESFAALIRHGLASDDDLKDVSAWCDVDPQSRSVRMPTHLKLAYGPDPDPVNAKVYLKVIEDLSSYPPVAVDVDLTRPIESAGRRLHDHFFDVARDLPDHTALQSVTGETISYGDLSKRVLDTAGWLGPLQGELVAVQLPHGPDQVVACLAILRAGGAYLPIDPDWPAARVEQVISLSGVNRVVTSELLGRVVGGYDVPSDTATEDDLAYVIYTSGTTGTPKGVMIRHRSAVNTIEDINQKMGLTAADRVAAVSSIAFDLSVWDVFGTLGAGAALVYPARSGFEDPAATLRWLSDQRVTVWNSVPARLQLLVDEARTRRPADAAFLGSLRVVMLSGDWIPVALPRRLRETLAPNATVFSLGGATEASIWSILHPVMPKDEIGASIPYGYPRSMRAQQVLVLSDDLSLAKVGEPGELFITGEGVAAGYWRDPALTASRFVDLPGIAGKAFRTGDLGYYRPDGVVIFLGRSDQQVKVRGYRVDLSEIEAVLARNPKIQQVAAIAPRTERGDAYIAVFCVSEAETEGFVSELLEDLHAVLPSYAVPHKGAVTFLDALPTNDNQKIDRAALLELAGQSSMAAPLRSSAMSTVAGDGLRERVRARFEEVLRSSDFDDDANFFELGGDSLLAISLIAHLGDDLGRTLPISLLFETPTPRLLAAALEAEGDTPRRIPEDDAAALPTLVIASPDTRGPDVFVTGATGFLGAKLVHEVARRTVGKINCLVRGKGGSAAAARERLLSALKQRGVDVADIADRLVAVPGDLAHARLGMRETDWHALAHACGEVFHCGADVNFAKPYDDLWPSNVDATRQVIEFCAVGGGRLHFVSSLAVFGTLHAQAFEAHEDDRRAGNCPKPVQGGYWEGEYIASKWVAEQLVWDASDQGLFATVHRPGFLFGDSKNGALVPESCFPILMLRESVLLGAYPAGALPVAGAAVDEVARSIAAVACAAPAPGRAYHQVAAEACTWQDWIEAAMDRGYPMRPVSFDDWRALLFRQSREAPARHPYADIILAVAGPRTPDLNAPTISRRNTATALGGSDIKGMNRASVRANVAYLTRENFFQA